MAERKMKSESKKSWKTDEKVEISYAGEKEEYDVSPSLEEATFEEIAEEAKENFMRVCSYVDILFMSTKHDAINILEINSPENIIKKLWDMGIQTVILKAGDKKGYYTGYNGNIVFTDFYTTEYLDTTCSGDAFNGGFLHAITHGFTQFEAVKFASIVAGLQAKGIGAIKSIPSKDEVYSIYRGNND